MLWALYNGIDGKVKMIKKEKEEGFFKILPSLLGEFYRKLSVDRLDCLKWKVTFEECDEYESVLVVSLSKYGFSGEEKINIKRPTCVDLSTSYHVKKLIIILMFRYLSYLEAENETPS